MAMRSMSRHNERVGLTRTQRWRWLAAGVVIAGSGLGLAASATSQTTPSAADKLALLRGGAPAELPASAVKVARGETLASFDLDAARARGFAVGSERWAVAPARDGGACLIAPNGAVVCGEASSIATGGIFVVRVDVAGPGGRAAGISGGDVTGVAPDGVKEVRARSRSGAIIDSTSVRFNAYRLTYQLGQTLEFVKGSSVTTIR